MLKEFKITVYTDTGDITADKLNEVIGGIPFIDKTKGECAIVEVEELCGEPVDNLENVIIDDPIIIEGVVKNEPIVL